jgi:uncharacterized protein YdhG (YjbR/CyaY superfamily)
MKKQGTWNEVDKYIMKQPEEVQRALQEVRSYIKLAAPDAKEMLNYQIPAFLLVDGGKRDQQIMIAGYKNHIGFYPHPSTIEIFADELTHFKTAKGSIQFPINKPIPGELIIRMVRFRSAEANKKQREQK